MVTLYCCCAGTVLLLWEHCTAAVEHTQSHTFCNNTCICTWSHTHTGKHASRSWARAGKSAAGAVAAAARELRPVEIVGVYEAQRETLEGELAAAKAEVRITAPKPDNMLGSLCPVPMCRILMCVQWLACVFRSFRAAAAPVTRTPLPLALTLL